MKTLLFLGIAACLNAQVTTILPTDPASTGPAVLNANFAYLNTALIGKVGTADSRLTDARTPLAHVHLVADITGFQAAVRAAHSASGPIVYDPATGIVSCPTCGGTATATGGLLAWYDFRQGANPQVLYDKSGNHIDALRGSTLAATGTDFTWLPGRGAAFAGAQSVNLYNSGINAGFNGAEGTIQITFMVASAADWTDGVARDLIELQLDANNQIVIGKSQDFGAGVHNRLSFLHLAGGVYGGTNWMQVDDVAATGYITLTCTWSKANNRMRAYLNGSLVREAFGLGVWAGGNLNASSTALGAAGASGASGWNGNILDTAIYSRELSTTEVAANYALVSGYTQALPTVGRVIGFMGDSILQSPGIQVAQVTDTMPFPYHAAMALNSPSLNKGVSGNLTSDMVARFNADIVANLPYVVLIEGGTNDANSSLPVGTVTGNYTTMINAATAAGIKTMVLLITPATSKDNAQMALIDTFNAAIQALPASNGFINCNSAVGQFRVGGAAGNLWDWQPALVGVDGLHPNEAGARALGACVAAGMVAAGLTAAPNAPVPNVSGSDITEAFVAGTGGVTANTFVTLDTSSSGQMIATTTSGTTWYGVALSTVAAGGTVLVRRLGNVQVLLDSGTATIGNAAVLSSTVAGRAHDSGGTRNSISILNSTATFLTSCASACAGTLVTLEITPADRGTGAAALVDKTIANSYTAGAKQAFQASASTAGMNFGGVASDPTTVLEGDVWYNTTLHTMRQVQNGIAVSIPGAGGVASVNTRVGAVTIVSGDIPNNAANTSGNAATASALAALPTLCTGGLVATGILANGNATGCTAAGGGASPLTTKGDLFSHSTVDARLPVGADAQVLTADSTQAFGIKWAAPVGSSIANPYTNVNAALVYSANPIPCLKGPIPFTQWSGIASQQGQGTRLLTAPVGFRFLLASVEPGTAFAGTGITTLSLGLGSASVPVGFMNNFQIFPTLTPPYNDAVGGIRLAADGSTLDVFGQLTVTSGAGLLNALTAGTVTITVCGMVP